jgi:methylmalonyl-CoA mutase cobalamin-binding domain/chain
MASGRLPERTPGAALKRRKATDTVVFGGRIIPDDDIAALKKQGVEKLFTPGTPLQDIVDWLRKSVPEEKRWQHLSVSSS